jgi:hypothetical protein
VEKKIQQKSACLIFAGKPGGPLIREGPSFIIPVGTAGFKKVQQWGNPEFEAKEFRKKCRT